MERDARGLLGGYRGDGGGLGRPPDEAEGRQGAPGGGREGLADLGKAQVDVEGSQDDISGLLGGRLRSGGVWRRES